MKNGVVGDVNFSVPSPHFQTFLFIDLEVLTERIVIHRESVESYSRLLKVLDYDMRTEIVREDVEYQQSFVNLDDLFCQMCANESLFCPVSICGKI